MFRPYLAALTLSLIAVGCSDSTAPRATPPAAGVYVLRSINGDTLPNSNEWPSYVTAAETLFVASDESYFVTGAYSARYVPGYYEVSPRYKFQISGDTVIAPALGQGGNGPGSFGAAALSMKGDTLIANYLSGGSTRYQHVPTPAPPGPVASLVLIRRDSLLVPQPADKKMAHLLVVR